MKTRAKVARQWLSAIGFVVLGSLVGCSGDQEPGYAQLAGQVGGVGGADSKASHYAASRFLEHASMGASPTSVGQVRAQGLESWIDRQQKMAPSLIRTPNSTTISLAAKTNSACAPLGSCPIFWWSRPEKFSPMGRLNISTCCKRMRSDNMAICSRPSHAVRPWVFTWTTLKTGA